MNYPILNLSRLRPELRGKYSASGNISDLIPNGDRTGTTRKVPLNLKPGDYITFQNTKTGENIPGVYRVTGFETVDLKTAEGRERWSRNEGWSAEAAASFSNQVRDGATQIRFERVDVEQGQAAPGETTRSSRMEAGPRATVSQRLPSNQWVPDSVIHGIINKQLQIFGHRPPFVLLDSDIDLFRSVGATAQAQQAAAPGSRPASGMVFDGKIYLFRDALDGEKEVVRTIWHELLHNGIRRFMTEAQYIRAIGWIEAK
jgi:hypothetical protein